MYHKAPAFNLHTILNIISSLAGEKVWGGGVGGGCSAAVMALLLIWLITLSRNFHTVQLCMC